jgi:hypothetical protein
VLGLVWYWKIDILTALGSRLVDVSGSDPAAILPRVGFGLAWEIAILCFRIPSGMMSLAVMLPPSYHVDTWGLVDLGQLGPSSRQAKLSSKFKIKLTFFSFKSMPNKKASQSLKRKIFSFIA